MSRLAIRRCMLAVPAWGILLVSLRLVAWSFGLLGLLVAIVFMMLYRSVRQYGRTVRIYVVLSGVATGCLLAEKALDYHHDALAKAVTSLRAVTDAPTDRDALLAYARSGHLLREHAYGDGTGMDLIRGIRQEGIPNRIARLGGDPRLAAPWDQPDPDTNVYLSPRQHYEGFAAGPATAIETLIVEDDGPGSENHRAYQEFAKQRYGGLPADLPRDVQDRLTEDFLTNHPVGRNLVENRGEWSRGAAKEYLGAVWLFAVPGEVAHWLAPCGAALACGLVVYGFIFVARRWGRLVDGLAVSNATLVRVPAKTLRLHAHVLSYTANSLSATRWLSGAVRPKMAATRRRRLTREAHA